MTTLTHKDRLINYLTWHLTPAMSLRYYETTDENNPTRRQVIRLVEDMPELIVAWTDYCEAYDHN